MERARESAAQAVTPTNESEMEKILEGLVRWDKPFTKIWDISRTLVPLQEVAEFIDAITERGRKLLPLLEAGQAMRNQLGTGFQGHPNSFAWDAAKRKARGP